MIPLMRLIFGWAAVLASLVAVSCRAATADGGESLPPNPWAALPEILQRIVPPQFPAPYAPNVWLAVLIVGVAGSAHQSWSANLFSVVSDTLPKEAISSAVGLGGFLAYFTGGFVNKITGNILQSTGSYLPVFVYFSGLYLLSLLAIQLLVPKIGKEERS